MTDDTFEDDGGSRQRRWRGAFSWVSLLGLGWLVYEMTALPALGILSVCIKFGWERFRTAYWLYRVDPVRRRAWACFALYVASGLWRVAGGASLLTAAFFVELLILFDLGMPRPPAGLLPAVRATAWTLGSTILGAAAVGCVACCLTVKYRLKVWLHPSLDAARRQQLWPPPDRSSADENRAEVILATGAAVTLLAAYMAALRGLDKVLLQLVDHTTRNLLVAFVPPGFLLLFIVCAGRHRQPGQRPLAPFLASRPSECWGDADRLEVTVFNPPDVLA